MKVVILGGNGYLGSKLGQYLFEQGIEVYSAVRREVEQSWAQEVWQLNDLEERLQTESIDWVINCITCYERGLHTSEDVLNANYVKPFYYFSLAAENGIRKFMTMDSGLPAECNLYSRSKKQFADSIEWKLNEICGENEYTFWNIKLENFYGEDEAKDRFIPGTIDKLFRNEQILLTKGTQIRDFIYIGDVVKNIEKLLCIQEKGRIDVPLGTGMGVTVHDAIVYLKEITVSQSKLCFGAVRARRIDPDCIADIAKMEQYNLEVLYDWKKGFQYITDKRRNTEDKK